MHPIVTAKNWSHHLHDSMLAMGHHLDQLFHSHHFWIGVGVTLLITGFVMLIVLLAKNAPVSVPGDYPYAFPYSPYW